MPAPAMRALLGFVAAAVSVLTFHQAMWALLHVLAIPGMGMPPPQVPFVFGVAANPKQELTRLLSSGFEDPEALPAGG